MRRLSLDLRELRDTVFFSSAQHLCLMLYQLWLNVVLQEFSFRKMGLH